MVLPDLLQLCARYNTTLLYIYKIIVSLNFNPSCYKTFLSYRISCAHDTPKCVSFCDADGYYLMYSALQLNCCLFQLYAVTGDTSPCILEFCKVCVTSP